MAKRILLIAYHFPPQTGSSGSQRTLHFARYLPKHGWEPLVLTIDPIAYEMTSVDQMVEVPPGLVVKRAFGLNTAKHLGFNGKYPSALAFPDRWISWWPAGVLGGMNLIRRYQPHAIWSTYPIATAHLIGLTLHRLSGLPWVAGFRDPMVLTKPGQESFLDKQRLHLEKRICHNAAWVTTTTPFMRDYYLSAYPELAPKISVIENGYDEEAFSGLDESAKQKGPLNPGKITILHSGLIYKDGRSPKHLLEALRLLLSQGSIQRDGMAIRFRSPGEDKYLLEMARGYGVEDMIEIMPAIPYREALEEMLRAEALLILQGGQFNRQIPAKLYEYLRTRRPILGFVDPRGDTARILKEYRAGAVADLVSTDDIATKLAELYRQPIEHYQRVWIERLSREARTAELANVLDSLPLKL